MKHYTDKMSGKGFHMRASDYNRQYDLRNKNVGNNQYNAQEISRRTGETSELIIEDNTVYEIGKECMSCLNNKKT